MTQEYILDTEIAIAILVMNNITVNHDTWL